MKPRYYAVPITRTITETAMVYVKVEKADDEQHAIDIARDAAVEFGQRLDERRFKLGKANIEYSAYGEVTELESAHQVDCAGTSCL